MKNDDLFNDSNGKKISSREVVEEVISFMKEDQKRHYKVMIGTDSQQTSNDSDFVTAIVVHRVGNGGRYFWRRSENGKFYTLRDRIITEVLLSIEVAKEVLMFLKSATTLPFNFEIHADVGNNGKTKTMISEVVGMIKANDFEAKTKPESYAASKVADRHT
ncbi:MAG: ribonuclease H-like YkuK family protein [Candidatus Wolfebacteria bacterium]|nr:ribonuclease H-like YkuK family protein [Candidatus Wolfebacteria bacterium]